MKVQMGLSQPFSCGYLDDHEETLLFYCDETPLSPELYGQLQGLGFRRSESMVYRPHCADCKKCKSIRLPVERFKMSKSQKRIANKGKHLNIMWSNKMTEDYYPLFEKYINLRHQGGSMFPAQPSQLDSFAKCDWAQPYFVEAYDHDKLIAVAIGDKTDSALSAVYTFFDPDYEHLSLGTLLVLEQAKQSKALGLNWLYLGYYIEECQKMNYKSKFRPFQILEGSMWIEVES